MKYSAGILCYRVIDGKTQVFLTHPGGPYYKGTDLNSWGIPKGLIEDQDTPYNDAVREFQEETGTGAPVDCFFLGHFKTTATKTVYVWCGKADFDKTMCISNDCVIDYMGDKITIPEIDGWEWFDTETAMKKAFVGQKQIIEKFIRLMELGI